MDDLENTPTPPGDDDNPEVDAFLKELETATAPKDTEQAQVIAAITKDSLRITNALINITLNQDVPAKIRGAIGLGLLSRAFGTPVQTVNTTKKTKLDSEDLKKLTVPELRQLKDLLRKATDGRNNPPT